MNYLFSHDIQNSLHAIFVSHNFTRVGEHNKKMSFKKIVAIKSQETQNKSSIIVD